jgi:hypothetical protein
MSSRKVTIIATLAVAGSSFIVATAGGSETSSDQAKLDRAAISAGSPLLPVDLNSGAAVSSLRIEHVRLEPAPQREVSPSAMLKFDMSNRSSRKVTDVTLEVSILEKQQSDDPDAPRRVIAGPFTIRGKVALDAGYTMYYEMLLSNLSPDCGCIASVDVLSLGLLPESGSGSGR